MAVEPSDKIVRGADLTIVGQRVKNALNNLPIYKTTDSHNAGQVLIAPKNGSGAATFRNLESEDIPTLPSSKVNSVALSTFEALLSGNVNGFLKRVDPGIFTVDTTSYVSESALATILENYSTTEETDDAYHPYGGDSEVDLEAGAITAGAVASSGSVSAGTTVSAAGTMTVGSGHTGGASTEDGYRVVNFGSLNQYIKLKNVGTAANPSWAFEFSAPFYDITSGTVPSGSSEVPSIPHVLIEKSAFEQISNPDNGTIYLIYEEE